MTNGERGESRDDGPAGQGNPHTEQPQQQADIRVELRDTLPGDRAVIGVEQEGEFMWLASRKYVHPKAVEEFQEQLRHLVGNRLWIQNWPGPN
jgi:hypothetical protein